MLNITSTSKAPLMKAIMYPTAALRISTGIPLRVAPPTS